LSRVVAPTETKDPVAFLSRVEPPPGTKGSLLSRVEPAPGTKSDRRLPCRYFLSRRWLLSPLISLPLLSLSALSSSSRPLPQLPSLLPPSGPQLPPRCGRGRRAAARARPGPGGGHKLGPAGARGCRRVQDQRGQLGSAPRPATASCARWLVASSARPRRREAAAEQRPLARGGAGPRRSSARRRLQRGAAAEQRPAAASARGRGGAAAVALGRHGGAGSGE